MSSDTAAAEVAGLIKGLNLPGFEHRADAAELGEADATAAEVAAIISGLGLPGFATSDSAATGGGDSVAAEVMDLVHGIGLRGFENRSADAEAQPSRPSVVVTPASATPVSPSITVPPASTAAPDVERIRGQVTADLKLLEGPPKTPQGTAAQRELIAQIDARKNQRRANGGSAIYSRKDLIADLAALAPARIGRS